MAVPQLLPQPVRLQTTDYRALMLEPIRFCGRQWQWAKAVDPNSIPILVCQVFVRVFAVVLLAPATLFAGGLAAVAALMHPRIDRVVRIDKPDTNRKWVEKSRTESQVQLSVRAMLSMSQCNVDVEIKNGVGVSQDPSYHSDGIGRYITVGIPTTTFSRFWRVVQNNFYNKPEPTLENLHMSLIKDAAAVEQLKEVLALHGQVTFYLAFDCAYMEIRLGS
jgi:hypothetical protein